MSEKLYRKKALSTMNSPESLNEIICVTNPGIWLILTALLVLLSGALCWGIMGEVETTIPVVFTEAEGRFTAMMTTYAAKDIQIGSAVRDGSRNCHVSDIRHDEDRGLTEIDIDYWIPGVSSMTGEIITGYFHPIESLWGMSNADDLP